MDLEKTGTSLGLALTGLIAGTFSILGYAIGLIAGMMAIGNICLAISVILLVTSLMWSLQDHSLE